MRPADKGQSIRSSDKSQYRASKAQHRQLQVGEELLWSHRKASIIENRSKFRIEVGCSERFGSYGSTQSQDNGANAE
jgi:hypothetical protein